MMEDLKIFLPLYEGPLDLLLDLIRRQKLDIYDIPIARVTEQYLAFLHLMEEWMSIWRRNFSLSRRSSSTSSRACCFPRIPMRVLRNRKIRERNSSAACSSTRSSRTREMIENAAWSNPGLVEIEDAEPQIGSKCFF